MSVIDRIAARTSLRVRIFLFFLLAAIATVVLVAGAGYVALRAVAAEDHVYVLRAVIVSGFGILAILTAIWLQFDTHVARPLERLGRYAHAAAHAEELSHEAMPEARYLGYLGPALADLSRALDKARGAREEAVREATARAER